MGNTLRELSSIDLDDERFASDRQDNVTERYATSHQNDVTSGRALSDETSASDQRGRAGRFVTRHHHGDDRDDRDTVKQDDKNTAANAEGVTSSDRERDRAERFVTLRQDDVQTLRPFYDGDYVTRRMAEIRKSIDYIRENWHLYDEFLTSLKKIIKEIPEEEDSHDLVERARSLFSSRKDWKDNASDVGNDPFDAIRVYTSEVGYSSFFAVIYAIFRNDESTASVERIRSAVFLVELLNIDLFNYCLKNPSLGNFQGTVYRGLSVSQDDLNKFKELFTRPISQRYISVPLGLMSSSLDRAMAEEFLSLSIATSDPSRPVSPLLMVIHVIELKPEYLQFYREKFPESVVTGICAVNIEDLSYHKKEREVILRGPFFQVLALDEGKEIAGRTSHVIEMVMLNSNRDHVTSVQLGQREAGVRQLFGTMVGVTRCEFCVQYYRERGLVEEERQYQDMLEQKMEQLTTLMSKV